YFSSTLPPTQVFLKGEGIEAEAVEFVVLYILHFSPYIFNIYNLILYFYK
ncbi:hypothetical protein B296_00013982, partial [Ensete ventricosum]